MDLSRLTPASGSVKNRKRIARGQGSGRAARECASADRVASPASEIGEEQRREQGKQDSPQCEQQKPDRHHCQNREKCIGLAKIFHC